MALSFRQAGLAAINPRSFRFTPGFASESLSDRPAPMIPTCCAMRDEAATHAMKEFTTRWQRHRGWAGAIAALLLFAVPVQSADDEEKEEEELSPANAELARKYAAVVGWKG